MKTLRTLYLVRHGQRLDAIDKNWYSNTDEKYDPPLSAEGHAQAQKVAQRLRQEPIDLIISSPYVRALQTAHPIAQDLKMPYIVDEGVGEWLGRAMVNYKPTLPTATERQHDFPYIDDSHENVLIPTYPETVKEVFARYKQAMNLLFEQYEGNILVVGHGRVVTGISHVLTGKPESHFKYDLACLTKLAYDGDEWHIRLNGDTSHLTSEQMPFYV